jgi:hypothetical protein
MVVLLLDRARRVSAEEARRVVRAELGEETAATVRPVGDNPAGMSYIDWRHGTTPYHLGTSSEPYINAVGVGKVDRENKLVSPLKWTMHEEAPPEDEGLCRAWMSHIAWLYVDALLFHSEPEDDELHLRHVLRIASHFVDERCVLLWLRGGEPKRVTLPTAQATASLRAGEWPE